MEADDHVQNGGVKAPAPKAALKEVKQQPKEIQISDQYEDDDFKIYFDKKSLLQHIHGLEDQNLFQISLVQDDQNTADA